MDAKLLTPDELDSLLRFPPGRAERMARRGKLPHLLLPTGEIRFDATAVEAMLASARQQPAQDAQGAEGRR